MKIINLHVLVIVFAFSQLNPMDRQENAFFLQDIKSFVKENPVVSFIAAIGIPTFLLLCYKKFIESSKPLQFSHSVQNQNAHSLNQSSDDIQVSLWIKPGDGDLIGLTSQDLEKYPVLDYYVARFASKNSKDTPLKIGSKEGLDQLLSKNVGSFLKEIALNSSEKQVLTIDAKKQLECDEEINLDEIIYNMPEDISIYMAGFLQCLSKDPGFLLTEMVFHNGYPICAEHQDKHFFTDKNIYWKKISWKKQCFYDQNDKHLLTLKYKPDQPINNGLLFIPAYNGGAILTHGYEPNDYVKIYDLMTGEHTIIERDFKNFDISPDGRWVGVRSRNTNTIEIYSTNDIKQPVAKIQHNNLKDFIFSSDGSKLISWGFDGERKVILWDLQNIKHITSTELCSGVLQFSHVMWNSDNKHICLAQEASNYEYDKNSIKNVSNIVLMNIENKEGKMFGPFSRARIFPDQSDIVLGEFVRDNHYSCTLLHKSGNKLVIPQDLKSKICSINGDYIAFNTQRGACIFDHQMNPVFKIDCSLLPQLRLTSCTENIMISRRFEGEKLKDSFSWSLPDERTKESFKEISKAMTVPQFLLLQEVCLQQRKPRELLILQEKEHQRIFKTFDVSHQSFLKEKLYLELSQAS